LAWAERAGYQDIEDIEPVTVAAYIETLWRLAAPPTVKQHMAAIRMMFSWLTEKGVLAMNPAREVKTERFSRTEGKTPAFVEGEVQTLLAAIETSTHTGLRDRALLGVLAYTFARIGAVVNLKVEDYYPSGKRFLLRFKEKGGKVLRPQRPCLTSGPFFVTLPVMEVHAFGFVLPANASADQKRFPISISDGFSNRTASHLNSAGNRFRFVIENLLIFSKYRSTPGYLSATPKASNLRRDENVLSKNSQKGVNQAPNGHYGALSRVLACDEKPPVLGLGGLFWD
jgi:hypothetical protein